MSVYSRLKSLFPGRMPLEDFFTEIVADLFVKHTDLLLAWLSSLRIPVPEPRDALRCSVMTQWRLPHTQVDDPNSRLDLLIELALGEERHWIIVESKVESHEGWEQLRRYADALVENKFLSTRTLVFISRHAESKDVASFPPGVKFIQSRWHTFYHFLKKYHEAADRRANEAFILETIQFMEEIGMSQDTQFGPTDIMALTGLTRLFGLLNQTMDDDVVKRFESAVGGKSRRLAVEQYTHNRFMLHSWFAQKCWTGIGFRWYPDEPGRYPSLIFIVEISPKANDAFWNEFTSKIAKVTAENEEWRSYNEGLRNMWSGMQLETSFHRFLSEENHVEQMKDHLLGFCKEWERIKQRYAFSLGMVDETLDNGSAS